MRSFFMGSVLIFAMTLSGCSMAGPTPAANTTDAVAPSPTLGELSRIEQFFRPMGRPSAGDWLSSHHERGETFREYLAAGATKIGQKNQTIYVQPLGQFTARENKLIETTCRFLRVFFDTPVELLGSKKYKPGPGGFRLRPYTRSQQWKAGPIIEDVLPPLMPADAAALVGVTAEDLYADETTRFIFGRSNGESRVGILSLSRLGTGADARRSLVRTLKIAAHETGHLFSMRHCTKYECVMSGTNGLGETDRRPSDACPECTAKIKWFSNVNVKDRYVSLSRFFGDNALAAESAEMKAKAAAVSN